MAKIKVERAEQRRFEDFILGEVDRIISSAIDKMDDALFASAVFLADEVKNSEDFRALKTPTLIGQFGFTPQEVSRLDDLFPVIGPKAANEVTSITKGASGKKLSAVLQWVDFEKLKFHQVADHPLTRFNPRTGGFEGQGVVSWIEWWEHGVTIRGHIFTRGNFTNQSFSRSGQGLMQTRSGSTFEIRPTRVFERIGEQNGKAAADRIAEAFKTLVGKVA